MLARDIMTRDPACCSPSASIQEAARLMKHNDCGCIPIVEDESRQLVGVVTDRDIAVRAIADGMDASTSVQTLMTADPACCSPESDLQEIERIMAERQVRRVPITDEDGCCVGIVSQADLALAEDGVVSQSEVGKVVERISETQTRRRTPVH
jgi:CBS domain-containing protein